MRRAIRPWFVVTLLALLGSLLAWGLPAVLARPPAPASKSAEPTPSPMPPLGAGGLSVFAASSLKEAFTEAGQNFKRANPNVTDLRFNFQGSQALVAQLQQGAPGDIFA